MIHADCAFRIGKTHLVCQDYALVGTGEFPCVLLADGCSGSPETDFGARLLVRSALPLIDILFDVPDTAATEGNMEEDSSAHSVSSFSSLFSARLKQYHLDTIKAARCHAAALGLPDTALDATLLTLATHGENWFASLFGDGVVVAKNRSGVLEITVVSYPGGYPYYINYEADPARKRALLQQKNNQRHVNVSWLTAENKDEFGTKENNLKDTAMESESTEKSCNSCPPASPCHYVHGRLADYQWVAILSDGLHTFFKVPEDGTAHANLPLPLTDVLRSLLAFKTMTGQFVQRRMQRFQQDCAHQGWQHHDDISVGVIVF